MRFSVYQVSRRGGREKNEDRMGYCYTRESGLFAVADGMGGHPEGEVASQLTLQTMALEFQRDAKPSLADPNSYLANAVLAAHNQLLRYAGERKLPDTPRSTVVACVIQGNKVFWAHCGDSRLYLVRGGRLVARTRDHSYSELQDALGRLTPTTERFNRNVLFTCLGSPGKPMVDLHGPMVLETGDRLLLCSDGLWGAVSDEDITRHLGSRQVTDSVPDLVELALRQGGPRCDNVTAVAVEWEGFDEVEEPSDSSLSTEVLSDEDFATTIQQADAAADRPQDLDEAEIERSVREIQDAIQQRSAKKK
ncbi:PP2C family serine/threonine-protein phosphatase [Pelomonas sp. SE-A7]|uniref:PP2C family protein-serine/threonine phosphatase n=1 Tax=Pelomonas sp. SE-A7 TaxID=3054953 RepID=UPI00259C7C99|nr:PP2C family serine/threonine-protein phosphatase [Pelomonas sp. SE-A7]MDM4764588.1 serine/threonine-protein phosphatase [Pelomonas sp. SE-A7]